VYLCCNVKNPDELRDHSRQGPPIFRTMRAPPCRHNHRTTAALFHNLQRVTGRISTGQKICDEIRKMVETQTQSEYEECVEYGGFVQSGRPGTLPYCEALSGAAPSGGSAGAGPAF